MADGKVSIETDGAVAVVTLNHPEKRNALSLAVIKELLSCLELVEQDDDVRVVIMAAEGKVFCSGHDLSEMRGRQEAEYRELFIECTRLMEKLQAIPQPVIAEVQGTATAAGCQLVASCDLAVASEEARFATPGVRIGLFCTTPMVAVSRAVGRKRALEMLLTGEAIDAKTAADWGLINRVVTPAELRPTTRALAGKIAAASSLTVGIGKQAFYEQVEFGQTKAYRYANDVMTANVLAEDAQEGITAFLEKRPAMWAGH